MRHPLLRLVGPVIALALAACKGDTPPAPAPAPATAPAPAPAPAEPARTMDDVMTRVAAMLAQEQEQRPNPGPSVEDVLARFAAAGLAPDATKQVVAATARARYCASGTRGPDSIAVCEYASPADAAAGRDHVRARFAALEPTRIIAIRGATTITISGRPTAELEATYRPVLQAP